MPGIWGGGTKICTELGVYAAAGGGLTVDVGHVVWPGVNWTGPANIDANLTNVGDITDPAGTGGWTDIISLSGQRMLVNLQSAGLLNSFALIDVDLAEVAGRALRMQVLVDGSIVGDITAIGDGLASQINAFAILEIAGVTGVTQFECNDSFLIRGARKGAFAQAGSNFRVANLNYWHVI